MNKRQLGISNELSFPSIPFTGLFWVTLQFSVLRQEANKLSDVLLSLGSVSVSFEDQDEGSALEKPIYHFYSDNKNSIPFRRQKALKSGQGKILDNEALWDRCLVNGLFTSDLKPDALVRKIQLKMGWKHKPNVKISLLRDQNWVEETQKQWNPIQIGENFWVVPSWHAETKLSEKAIIIKLDPGLAFGTGTHPTTRLCLETMEQQLKEKDVLLDYGCGSGILAIGALKLGASKAMGVDIDPQALQACTRNALENHVSLTLYLHGNVPSLQVDVLVANILLNPLLELKPIFLRVTKPHSRIILSGILVTQVKALVAAYASEFDFTAPKILEDWACIFGVRRT